MRKVLCFLIGHQYRNAVPRILECKVYCGRCGRVFGHFDSATIREYIESIGGMKTVLAAMKPEPPTPGEGAGR